MCSASAQATASSIRTVPARMPRPGITLAAAPAWTIPHTTLTPARGSRRRLKTAGSSVMSLPSAKVRSSVRWGRDVCPPLPPRRTTIESAAPVSGPSRTPDLPDVETGVAVQPEDLVHVVERAGLDQVQRSPGHDLLGRLEEQAHAAVQEPARLGLAQREGGAHQPGGVHVVAAGVGHARHGARPGVDGVVLDRERVEIGTQRDPALARPDLADDAAALDLGEVPLGVGQCVEHLGGGARLGPGQLGMGMEVATEVDQLVGVLVDDSCDQGGRGIVCGGIGHDRPSLVEPGAHDRRRPTGRTGARLALVVRREDPVGGDRCRPARRPAPRRGPRRGSRATPGERRSRWSSSSRTSAQVKSSCWSARLCARPSAPEVLAVCQRSCAQTSSTPTSSRAEQVTTGGAHSPWPRTRRSAPASSRAAAAGLLLAVAVGLVDRDHVGDLEDALLDALQLVAGAGQGEEQEGVDHAGDGDLGLADADGLDQHHVVARRLEHHHRLRWSRGRRRRGCRPTGEGRMKASGSTARRGHPGLVAEHRAAGAHAGRVDRQHPDPVAGGGQPRCRGPR